MLGSSGIKKFINENLENFHPGLKNPKKNKWIEMEYGGKNYVLFLVKNGFCVIDEKYKYVLKKHVFCSNGYIVTTMTRYLHSIISDAEFGEKPKGLQVDHINRKKWDCRVKNLRYVTPTQNMLNRSMKSNVGIDNITKYIQRFDGHEYTALHYLKKINGVIYQKSINYGGKNGRTFEQALNMAKKFKKMVEKSYAQSED